MKKDKTNQEKVQELFTVMDRAIQGINARYILRELKAVDVDAIKEMLNAYLESEKKPKKATKKVKEKKGDESVEEQGN